MRIFWLAGALVLLLLLLMLAAFFHPDAYASAMRLHELDSTGKGIMLHSSTSSLHPPFRFWGGMSMGLLMIGLMGTLTVIGWQRKGKGNAHRPWLIASFVGYAAVFMAVCLSYLSYAQTESPTLWGGFPVPTAWMLYVLWLFPLTLVAMFLFRFDQWFLDPKDLERFQELVAEQEAKSEQS